MKNLRLGFKKYLKGMFGIFMIKLCIVGLIVINQACETEEPLIQTEARDSFLESLQISAKKVKSVQLNKAKTQTEGDFASRGLDENTLTSTVCLIDANQDLVGDYEDINTVGEVMELGGELDFTGDNTSGSSTTSTKYCFDIPVEPTEEALEPAILEAKNFLYNKGFNDTDVVEILEGNEEAFLPSLVAIIVNEESNTSYAYNEGSFFNFMLGIGEANAQNWGKIGKCAKQAFGLDILDDFRGWSGLKKKAKKKLMKKAIYTLAAKVGGGIIGAAVIVGEFAICMA